MGVTQRGPLVYHVGATLFRATATFCPTLQGLNQILFVICHNQTMQAPTGADGHMGATSLALQVSSIEAVGPGSPLPGQALPCPVFHGDVPCQQTGAASQVQQEVSAGGCHLVEQAGLSCGPHTPTLPPESSWREGQHCPVVVHSGWEGNLIALQTGQELILRSEGMRDLEREAQPQSKGPVEDLAGRSHRGYVSTCLSPAPAAGSPYSAASPVHSLGSIASLLRAWSLGSAVSPPGTRKGGCGRAAAWPGEGAR